MSKGVRKWSRREKKRGEFWRSSGAGRKKNGGEKEVEGKRKGKWGRGEENYRKKRK